jgi:hypothetical protein
MGISRPQCKPEVATWSRSRGVSPEESGARRNAARRSNGRYRVSFHKPATMRRHKLTAVAASAGVM